MYIARSDVQEDGIAQLKEGSMISSKMAKAINDQINRELYSAYLYLSMSAYFEDLSLKGFAGWFRVQYQEEVTHAMKFFDYLCEQGARMELQAIDKPPANFKSPLAVFEQSLKHEQFVTKNIYALVDLAIKEGDHATNSFLNWYVDEQVEEEANASEIVARIKLAGASQGALLYIDKELGKRKAGGD